MSAQNFTVFEKNLNHIVNLTQSAVVAQLGKKSIRTWQRWCQKRNTKRRTNGLKFERKHYQIAFEDIEPFLKKEFIDDPRLILNYVTR